MSIRRGDGPLTTDDGWWQKADGSWHPPETHPLRDTAGFLEELPEPPDPSLLLADPEPETPEPAEVAPVEPDAVEVSGAPVESPAVRRGPSPAERLSEALDDSEKITLPEAPPAPKKAAPEVVFGSEVVELKPERGRRGRRLSVPAAEPAPAAASDGAADDGAEIVIRSQVAEALPDARRRGRRRR